MSTKRPYRSLQDWLERTGTTQSTLAKMAQMPEATLSRILTRGRRCSLGNALKLHAITGVPIEQMTAWSRSHNMQQIERTFKRGRQNAA